MTYTYNGERVYYVDMIEITWQSHVATENKFWQSAWSERMEMAGKMCVRVFLRGEPNKHLAIKNSDSFVIRHEIPYRKMNAVEKRWRNTRVRFFFKYQINFDCKHTRH